MSVCCVFLNQDCWYHEHYGTKLALSDSERCFKSSYQLFSLVTCLNSVHKARNFELIFIIIHSASMTNMLDDSEGVSFVLLPLGKNNIKGQI